MKMFVKARGRKGETQISKIKSQNHNSKVITGGIFVYLFFKNILLLFTYDLYVNINYLFYVKSALKSRDLFLELW
jgi:hypothetical protein